ncbi:hypothetical protein TNCV_4797331 [Trichonephila clavipes]|nr:hypothetical protein TNCV_4797331 [Trichonephila clavipes]
MDKASWNEEASSKKGNRNYPIKMHKKFVFVSTDRHYTPLMLFEAQMCEGSPAQRRLFPEKSFKKIVWTKDRLDVDERKGVGTSNPFSESDHMCYALDMRKE